MEPTRARLSCSCVDLALDRSRIEDFCRRRRILDLAFFGSVLRPDFRVDSDVDVLVTFEPGAEWGLFDHSEMEEELAGILGRKVDLLTRRTVERSKNWIRKREILSSAEHMLRDDAALLDLANAARRAMEFVRDVVWRTLQVDLPALLESLQPLLPPDE